MKSVRLGSPDTAAPGGGWYGAAAAGAAAPSAHLAWVKNQFIFGKRARAHNQIAIRPSSSHSSLTLTPEDFRVKVKKYLLLFYSAERSSIKNFELEKRKPEPGVRSRSLPKPLPRWRVVRLSAVGLAQATSLPHPSSPLCIKFALRVTDAAASKLFFEPIKNSIPRCGAQRANDVMYTGLYSRTG
jgi:hypothetical protein